MRSRSVAIAVCLVIALPSASYSQQTTAQAPPTQAGQNTQNPQAAAVITAALSAMTGVSATVPTSLTASGTYTRWPNGNSVTFPIQLKALGVTSFRWDSSEPTGTVTTIVSGTSGSVQTPTS